MRARCVAGWGTGEKIAEDANYGVAVAPPTLLAGEDILPGAQQASSSSAGDDILPDAQQASSSSDQHGSEPLHTPSTCPPPIAADNIEECIASNFKPLTWISTKMPLVGEKVRYVSVDADHEMWLYIG